ncbi:MAG: protein jag [Bacilli bacterium]|nr:protein jag [Bacilli bacterium]
MKEFTGKTVEEAVANACSELGVAENRLVYEVLEEKKGLFKKVARIVIYDITDARAYAEEYLNKVFEAMGLDVEVNSTVEDDIIKVVLESDRNPILIGKNGKTLQSLNEITKLAVSNKYRHRYRVLLDVGDYKSEKYEKCVRIAIRVAKEVRRTKVDAELDPMTPDERRMVHNALTDFRGVRTESEGEGPNRRIFIRYVND